MSLPRSLSQMYADSTQVEIITALLLVLLVSLLLVRIVFARKASHRTPDLILLLGGCGSGKTSLFYRWSSPGHKIATVPSQTANRGKVLPNSTLEVVDYPGHPRLRTGLAPLLARAGKIVYLVDAAAGIDSLKAVAEDIFGLLVAKTLRPDAQLLVCCNKADLPRAQSPSAVEKILNAEIERLRTSRTQELEGENAADNYLGVDDEKFDIRSHAPVPVSFATCSVATGRIEDIESFLSSSSHKH